MSDVSSGLQFEIDEKSANHLLAVCHDGELFYRHAADSVESYSIKRTLQQMAITRRDIFQELSSQPLLSTQAPVCPDERLINIKLWYLDALEQSWDFADIAILEKLRLLEADNLNSLIKATRDTSHKATREVISNVAARFQLCLDMLDTIIEKQKS